MKQNLKQYTQDLIRRKPRTVLELEKLKRQLATKYKVGIIANHQILTVYRQLVKQPNPKLVKLLRVRAVRTLSGVAAIAVLTKPYPCPGKCIYCPNEKGMPKSYLSNEPAVMRAVLCRFDPYKQVQLRLRALEENGHLTDKVELIIMGGTWSYLPKPYQTHFIKRCFDALNKRTAKNLKQAQKWNETAKHRCVGLTLETRPDYVNSSEVLRMRKLGATKVELGVQHLDDQILKLNKRGHGRKEVIEATKLLRQAGFKIMYHMMPNLPGSTPAKDLRMFKELFTNPDFQPDLLKIYPCVVVKGAKIYNWLQQCKYRPYSNKQLLELLIKIKQLVPSYVRITRMIRDIPKESIEAGNKVSNLREIVQVEMRKRGMNCRCIRCREIRDSRLETRDSRLVTRQYQAANGKEIFLSYEGANSVGDDNHLRRTKKLLYAFLRLRLPNKADNEITKLIPELQGAALIRELHTYGQVVGIGKRAKAVQHLGFGRKLMAKAEKIVKAKGYQKIAVISGIGVREYYRKLGYRLQGTYMVKSLEKR